MEIGMYFLIGYLVVINIITLVVYVKETDSPSPQVISVATQDSWIPASGNVHYSIGVDSFCFGRRKLHFICVESCLCTSRSYWLHFCNGEYYLLHIGHYQKVSLLYCIEWQLLNPRFNSYSNPTLRWCSGRSDCKNPVQLQRKLVLQHHYGISEFYV